MQLGLKIKCFMVLIRSVLWWIDVQHVSRFDGIEVEILLLIECFWEINFHDIVHHLPLLYNGTIKVPKDSM